MITIIDDAGKKIEFKYTEDATRYLMSLNERIENKLAFVEQYININGSITRNFALGHYITRLSAMIFTLKEKGFTFSAGWDDNHKDYIYTMINRPKEKGLF